MDEVRAGLMGHRAIQEYKRDRGREEWKWFVREGVVGSACAKASAIDEGKIRHLYFPSLHSVLETRVRFAHTQPKNPAPYLV